LNSANELLRIRTIGAFYSAGTLDIRYATPTDLLTWSSNTITANAFAGCGVDLFVSGSTVQAYWIDSDAVTVKMAESSDDGHTWSVAETVAILSAQGATVAIQLCCPAQDVCIFTDSTVGIDDNGNPLTALYVAYKSSGTWQTPVLWDMGGQPLGVEAQVELPNGDKYTSNLSALTLNDERIAYALYSEDFRESFGAGVWCGRFSNLNPSITTQHLHWSSPEQIFSTVKIDDNNSETKLFTCFPRLQWVGSQVWIIALEISEYAGHERYHLAFFRSSDGIVFSDRDYNQGAANDEQEGAYLYQSSGVYNDNRPFEVIDLIYASLVVTPTRVFLCGFDKVFYCEATSLVGVNNPARQQNISAIVTDWTTTFPSAPSAGTINLSIGNVLKNWNGDDILTAHKGVKVKQLTGYFSSVYNEDELVELGEFWIDGIEQQTAIGDISGTVQGYDNVGLMEQWQSDVYWEWFGAEQMAFERFCDTISFLSIHGNLFSDVDGNLKSDVVKADDNFVDDIAVLNLPQSADGGVLLVKFRCTQQWGTQHAPNLKNHVGIAFQGKAGENDQFWAVLYNHVDGRFTLHRAVPRKNANRVKLYKYEHYVQESGVINLSSATTYWFKVGVWHGHIMAWYSTDGIHYTKVIDYTSPASPSNQVIPTRLEWWAIIGTARRQPSGIIGVTSTANGVQDLSDGSGNPLIVAKHVQLDNRPSILRRVAVAVTQESTVASPMPDLQIMLLSGDRTTQPDDATDSDNILFSRNASALYFNPHNAPKWNGANATPNPQALRFQNNEHVWIAVTFNDALVAGQSYKWASHAYANDTVYSTDGGATWQPASYSMAASIEVEYLYGLVKFNELYFGMGNYARPYEDLIHRIAAKAGVLEIAPDAWLSQSDLMLGADNIYWQPSTFGTIGNMLLDVDVVLGTLYSTIAKVVFGSSSIGSGDANGNIVEIDEGAQFINFYTSSNTLLCTHESLAYIPDSFHLQIVNQANFLYVYINETLAAIQYADVFGVAGYIGLEANGAVWSNARIPDLYHLVEYFDLSQKENANSALQRLVAKPAAGTVARGKYYARYDGKLRVLGPASYRNNPVDTYEDAENAVRILTATKSESQRYQVSEIDPEGNYYARRFSGKNLGTDGRIYRSQDFTDARSDADAYIAAQSVLDDAAQKQVVPSMTTLANFAAEREDKIVVRNPLDHTGDVFVIDTLTFKGNESDIEQETSVRLFIEEA
jgi:hypothetical protein